MFGRYADERSLEADIVAFCRETLVGEDPIIVTGFGVDIAIFSARSPKFIELKAFEGRCGIGGLRERKSTGNQVKLLANDRMDGPRSTAHLGALDGHVRWLLLKRNKEVGSERFAFFDCSTAAGAVAGGITGLKFHNFSCRQLDWFDDLELKKRLKSFLLA